VERYVYSPYGVLTIHDATWSNIRSASSYANAYTYTGRQLDTETGLYHYQARFLHAHLGTFVVRDPLYSDPNLYRYCANNPLLFLDPLGLEPGITGPCNIAIYAGHGIWPIGKGIEDQAVGDFRKEHDVLNPDIVTGCGNYLAYVGCKGAKLNAGVTDGRKVRRYPGIPGPVAANQMLGEVQKASEAARALQKKLCENRKKFCDDGTPERYKCGEDMQRCDTVTISVTCDADMKVLMETGIYQKRLWPGWPVVATWPVPGLPTKESISICGLSEKVDCNE